jgi:DNA polymerase III subunit delta'
VPFSTLGGQPRVMALLGRALAAGRVAHAYAFVGPPGSGRTTAALTFAEALLCHRPTAEGGCGRCRACALVGRRQHPDLHVLVPTPPERNPKGPRAIRIGDIRELERQASLRPAVAARKIFIVDDADRMTDDTPHAFLKTLEEPPDRTVMILVLASVRALPATVLSRCQIVRFAPRPDPRAEAARADALALFAEIRANGADALLRKLQSVDRDTAERLIDAYWLLCRDLLLASSGAPESLLVNGTAAAEIAREAARWSMDELLGELAGCREARAALETNVSPRLTVEVLLSRLATRAA